MTKILLVLLVLAVVVFLAVRLQGDAYRRFMVHAQEVMGRIEKKETRIDNPKTRHTEHILIYNYAVNGITYRGEERVEYDDLWLDAREGMELRVYYDARNPTKSYPAAVMDRRLGVRSALD